MRACVAIAEKDIETALKSCIEAAERGADLVEVRFDKMDNLPDDLSPFKGLKVPMIATLRSKGQGGDYAGDERAKLGFVVRASKNGFGYIDLEHDFPLIDEARSLLKEGSLIVSYHDFNKTPKASSIIEALVICASRGDIPKVAFKANRQGDVLALVEASKAYASAERDFVAISMGEKGAVTRACHDKIGTSFTYASLDQTKEVAPGQIDIATLKRLGDDAIVTGVTGQSLSHSLSPWMHNAAYRSLDLPGIYFKFQAEKEDLPDLLGLMDELSIRGTNVTIPHKESVLPLLDRLDPEAERIGAVNTVKNEGGEFVGHNTDVYGVEMTFNKAGQDPVGRDVLVMGAGGAARSVCAFLSRRGARVHLFNRSKDKADMLAARFDGVEVVASEDIGRIAYDCIVNCTPLGMKGYPDELSVPMKALRAGQFVMDTIYNPAKTRLLIEAEAVGAKAVSGKDMLIYQAMKAFEIWTGRCPEYEVMERGFTEGMAR